MKRLLVSLLISSFLFSFDNYRQVRVLNGIVTDGHRNRLIAINAIIKGTPTASLTDGCGRFSLPVNDEEITVLFQGMHYDDTRAYEITLKRSEMTADTLVFQLGHWKAVNPKCPKVKRGIRRYVIV